MSARFDEPISPTFRTLRQSLSTISTRPLSPRSRSRSLPERASPQLAISQDPQGTVLTADAPLPAGEPAFATLQYLPIPIIVLSSLKQVILVNEALKSLLATEDAEEDTAVSNGAFTQTVGAETLLGRSLSQIGIQMVTEGDQASTSLEDFLDDVVKGLDTGIADEQEESQGAASSTSLETSTGTAPHPPQVVPSLSPQVMDAPSDSEGRILVNDISVNVLIKPRLLTPVNDLSSLSAKYPKIDRQASAKVTISIWFMERVRYFTLTFQPTPWNTLPTTRPKSRVVSGRLDLAAVANIFSSAHDPIMGSHTFSGLKSSRTTSSSSLPQRSTVSQDSSRSDPVAQDRISRMKDAIIDTIGIPIMVMWQDGSLAVYNKAISRLMHEGPDIASNDVDKTLSRFRVYTEDFERELEQYEWPIVKLCREQKTFKGIRMGTIDYKRTRRVFEIDGDGIYDEQSGEFLAGICTLKDVTWYMDMVKQDEKKFQLICECIPQTVWTSTADGRVDYYSPRWYEFTGWTPGHLEGEQWSQALHPDDRAEIIDNWSRCLATGDDFVVQCRIQRHDGDWRWIHSKASPLRDKSGRIVKWFGTNTDTHDLIEARLSAKRLQDHLLNVITHASVTLWTVDNDLTITLLEGNLMWEDEPPEFMQQAVGKNLFHAFGKHQQKKDWDMFKELIEAILRGELSHWDNEHQLTEGKGRWYRTRLAPIRGVKGSDGVTVSSIEGSIEGLMGCSLDITEMKEREQTLRSQAEENLRLATAEHAAKETSRMKSQFLANMSHEIRTPIAGVIGMVEILLDTNLDREQREWAETIHRSANGLLTVINDVLDFSKVESGKLDLEEIPFILAVLVDDICKMLSFAAEQKGIDFKNEIHEGVGYDLVVLGDPGRVRQILTNLLTNSIKFTSKGYVKIAIRCEEESRESIKIFFTVKDTGIGIDKEVQKRLFQPFSQADSSTARKFGGTGLGLTICKSLVSLMGGGIELESELGRGTRTTFWISFQKPELRAAVKSQFNLKLIPSSLQPKQSMTEHRSGQQNLGDDHLNAFSMAPKTPLAKSVPDTYQLSAAIEPPSRAGQEPSSMHGIDRKSIHILVVEDNAVNQKIALRLIKKFGFSASAVWNGKEALDYLLEPTTPDHRSPDVILMDVQMPVLDGYRATHYIRHHNPFSTLPDIRALPIVAMTASAIQGDKEKCLRAGMNDYLSKPVKGPILEDMLLKWALEGKRQNWLLDFADPHSSDHGSVCDHPSSCSVSDPSDSVYSPNPKEQATPASVQKPQASTNIAGRRGLQRNTSSEQASYLRNDKLLAASEPSPWNLQISLPPPRPYKIPGPGTTPLTEQNIARLDRENRELEVNPFEYTFACASEINDLESLAAASQPSSPQAIGESASGSPTTPAKAESLRVVLGGKLVKNESSSSQITITAFHDRE